MGAAPGRCRGQGVPSPATRGWQEPRKRTSTLRLHSSRYREAQANGAKLQYPEYRNIVRTPRQVVLCSPVLPWATSPASTAKRGAPALPRAEQRTAAGGNGEEALELYPATRVYVAAKEPSRFLPSPSSSFSKEPSPLISPSSGRRQGKAREGAPKVPAWREVIDAVGGGPQLPPEATAGNPPNPSLGKEASQEASSKEAPRTRSCAGTAAPPSSSMLPPPPPPLQVPAAGGTPGQTRALSTWQPLGTRCCHVSAA